MGIKISAGKLSAAIAEELEKYAEVTGEEVKQIAKEVSADAVKEIKGSAPKRTKKYAASWKSKKLFETSTKAGYVIYSKDHYRLTHLLEKDHAKRNGGRVSGIPHLGPAEEKAVKEFESRLRKELG